MSKESLKSLDYFPKNKAHFKKLIIFAKEILKILKNKGISPVIYGSFSHFYHTKDKSMNVNDIDIYIPEKAFTVLVKEFKKRKINCSYQEEWHSMQVSKNEDIKVELDSMDYYYTDSDMKSLPKNFLDFDFYGEKVKLLPLENLEILYKSAYLKTQDNKEKISAKIAHLKKFKENK